MAKKKHKTHQTTPMTPKTDTIIITVPVVALGPQIHWPRAAFHQHRNMRRLNTRQAQQRQAFKDQ
jgi:hypothetical protein